MDTPIAAPSWGAAMPPKRTRQAAGRDPAAASETAAPARMEGSTSAVRALGEGPVVTSEQAGGTPAADQVTQSNNADSQREGSEAQPSGSGHEDLSLWLGPIQPQGVVQGDSSSVFPAAGPTTPRALLLQHQHQQQQQQQLQPQHQVLLQQQPLSTVQAAHDRHAEICGGGQSAGAGCGTGRAVSESRSLQDRLVLQDSCSDGFAAAVASFSDGVSSLQQQLLQLVAEAARERKSLAAERAALQAERVALEHERTRVAQVINEGQQVLLSVGGKRYTTSITTLRNAPEPSLFSAMFSGRHALRPSEADGSIFIDRDGTHFATILNFLRDGTLAYPPDGTDYKFLLELRSEAQFYGLSGLTAAIDRYPWGLLRASRCAQLNTTDNWLYEDGPDEVVFSVDAPCQLLGMGLSGTESGYSADIEVVHVADDFSVQLKVLATLSQSFVQADGPIVRAMLPTPVTLVPGHNYMLHALIKGTDSFYVEEALELVVVGGVRLQFMPWESPNGTNEQRGQFPEVYIRPLCTV